MTNMNSLLNFCTCFCQAQPYPLHLYQNDELIFCAPESEIDLISPHYALLSRIPQQVFLQEIHDSLLFGGVFSRDRSRLFLLGPAPMHTEVNEEFLHKLMGEYGFSLKQKKALRSYLERSNGNSYLQFRNILQLLYFFLYREMAAEIPELNLSSYPLNREMNKKVIEDIAEDADPRSYQLAYEFERQVLTYIRDGNTAAFRQGITASQMHIGTLSHSNLRQCKNLFICIVSLATRAAIDGGLDLETAYRLSDFYIQRGENTQTAAGINELIDTACLDFAQRTRASKFSPDMPTDLYNCLQYIRQNVHTPLRVRDVAAYAHLSVSQLERKFHNVLGFYPSEFIIRCKLEEAKNLLAHTNRSLNEISQILCFSSQSYFCNVFKKKYQMTPGEYRRSRAGQADSRFTSKVSGKIGQRN